MPAGEYRLTLLTGGAPTQVVLRFDGLDGMTTIRPHKAFPAQVMQLPKLDPVPADAIRMFGADGRLPSEGWIMWRGQQHFYGDDPVLGLFERCIYTGGAPDAGIFGFEAYAPGCSTDPTFPSTGVGSAMVYPGGGPQETPGLFLSDVLTRVDADVYGLGGNAQVITTGAPFTAYGAWIPFEP